MQTVIVGATSGIGKQVALQLATRGDAVIGIGRDQRRAAKLATELAAHPPAAGTTTVVVGDVSTAAGIDAVTDSVRTLTNGIDVLINGAGVAEPHRKVTSEGCELNFAVHHLAPYSMTSRLLPLLRNGGGRVVNINSEGHRAPLLGGGAVEIDFSDLQSERNYDPWLVYSRTKLANLLFAQQITRRHPELCMVSLHPGMVRTNLGRSFPRVQVAMLLAFATTPARGAAPVVELATKTQVPRGSYFDRFTESAPSRAARDSQAAERLWTVTEDLRGPFAQ